MCTRIILEFSTKTCMLVLVHATYVSAQFWERCPVEGVLSRQQLEHDTAQGPGVAATIVRHRLHQLWRCVEGGTHLPGNARRVRGKQCDGELAKANNRWCRVNDRFSTPGAARKHNKCTCTTPFARPVMGKNGHLLDNRCTSLLDAQEQPVKRTHGLTHTPCCGPCETWRSVTWRGRNPPAWPAGRDCPDE